MTASILQARSTLERLPAAPSAPAHAEPVRGGTLTSPTERAWSATDGACVIRRCPSGEIRMSIGEASRRIALAKFAPTDAGFRSEKKLSAMRLSCGEYVVPVNGSAVYWIPPQEERC